ncbi:Tn3 family transposase [Streptomyces sp. T12]|uniref:Tn3 family transposase n=1 Tax=Streptomyces sp. T12 TaxID=477697 RepID=UPI0035A295CF
MPVCPGGCRAGSSRVAAAAPGHARLDISQAWGDGSTTAADGTHMDTYLNNLLSETSVIPRARASPCSPWPICWASI